MVLFGNSVTLLCMMCYYFTLRFIPGDFGVGTFILLILLKDYYYSSRWGSYNYHHLQIPNQKCSCSFNCCCYSFDFSNVFAFLTVATPFIIIISLHPSAALSDIIVIIIPLTENFFYPSTVSVFYIPLFLLEIVWVYFVFIGILVFRFVHVDFGVKTFVILI